MAALWFVSLVCMICLPFWGCLGIGSSMSLNNIMQDFGRTILDFRQDFDQRRPQGRFQARKKEAK
jgi:hypothetical protein